MLHAPLLDHLRKGYRAGRQWTELCDEVAGELHARGVGREAIEDALRAIPVHAGMLAAVREASAAAVPIYIVSDANTEYIRAILAHLGLDRLVARVVTNPAHWEAGGRLRIRKYVDAAAGAPPHGCARCPVNMCKARILCDELRLLSDATEVLYVGDGSGDTCPCLAMHA